MPNVQLFDRVVVGVDVRGFSSRNVRRQLLIQDELDRMLTEAAQAAGLDRGEWDRRGDGDGEVAVLPAGVDLLLIVRKFVTELDRLLADHNEDHGPETEIRLRIAMNVDSVVPGGRLGHGGKALIDLARLLDSRDVRKALEDVPEANLAQIISESLFQRAVVPAVGGMRTDQFRKVVVDVPAKGFSQNAYIYLPCGWPKPRPAEKPPSLGAILPTPGPWSEPQPTPLVTRPAAPRTEGRQDSKPLDEEILDLLASLREAVDAGEHAQADGLTTRILLQAAGRDREGSLRTSDAERLPDALFTELDLAWAASSKGRWGFAAQRRRLTDSIGSGRVRFHPLALAFGWRQSDDSLPPPYAAFVATADGSELPFFPTLRSPERENGGAWREEWRTTAVSIHLRLRRWE